VVFYATGLPPAYPLDPRLGTAVPRPWERVLRGTGEMAYINDVAWDLVAYNEPLTRMFPRREVPGNTMRWMLLHPQARTTLVDWRNSWLPLLVPQLRAAVAANPHNRTLALLQADARRDPLVGAAYETPTTEYMGPRAEGARPLLHAELGLGWATLCAAGPFGVPGGRLMFVLFDRGERPAAAAAVGRSGRNAAGPAACHRLHARRLNGGLSGGLSGGGPAGPGNGGESPGPPEYGGGGPGAGPRPARRGGSDGHVVGQQPRHRVDGSRAAGAHLHVQVRRRYVAGRRRPGRSCRRWSRALRWPHGRQVAVPELGAVLQGQHHPVAVRAPPSPPR